MTTNQTVSIGKYVGLFALFQALLMVIFNILAHGFDIDLGSGTNIAILMGAAIVTSNQFVNKNKRAPGKLEKNKLIAGCILSSFAISALGVLVVVIIVAGIPSIMEIPSILPELSAMTWLAIVAVVTVIHYLALSLSFGWHAKRYASKIQQKA